jgi:hypothetical protein
MTVSSAVRILFAPMYRLPNFFPSEAGTEYGRFLALRRRGYKELISL